MLNSFHDTHRLQFCDAELRLQPTFQAFGCLAQSQDWESQLCDWLCFTGKTKQNNKRKMQLLSCEVAYKQKLYRMKKLIPEKWNLEMIIVNLGLKGKVLTWKYIELQKEQVQRKDRGSAHSESSSGWHSHLCRPAARSAGVGAGAQPRST